MMHELEKSDPSEVARKPANNSEGSEAEPVERRGGRGEHGQAPHAPDAEPGKCVFGT
jgi:hypothetical protein